MLMALALASVLDGTLFYNQPLFFCALGIAILASASAASEKVGPIVDNRDDS